MEQADAAWARREDPAALERAIALYEEAAQREIDPSPALLGSARARRMRAEQELKGGETEGRMAAAATHANVCAGSARRSWAMQYPAAGAQLDARAPAEVYAQVPPPGAEALYLEAVCTSLWARTQGFTPLIERRTELMAELSRVADVAPVLDGAGAERELGALLSALPTYAGGDLKASRDHLERAIQYAPDEPRNRLQLARTVAVKSQDRALFVAQLRKVAEGPDKRAAAEAGELLARTDELFGPAEAAQPVPGGTQK